MGDSGGMAMSKVKIRLMAPSKNEVEKLRRHLLKKHPQLILSNPRQGSNPKYAEKQNGLVTVIMNSARSEGDEASE